MMGSSVPALLFAGILTLAGSAKAGPIFISFDQLSGGEDVGNSYDGGLGPSLNFGVSFELNHWTADPPDVYYFDLSVCCSAEISGLDNVMTVSGGWSGGVGILSFYYYGPSLTVTFYDELGN